MSASSSDYCIVVSAPTRVAWGAVVAALEEKHRGLRPLVLTFEADGDGEHGGVGGVLAVLRACLPRYTVFVAQPAECTRAFVRAVHHLTRSLDPAHVFSDTLWGILAAASLADALRIAREAAPLEVRTVFAGTVEGSELACFGAGTAYNELQAGSLMTKAAGQAPQERSYDGDETVHLAGDLNRCAPDMIITSGHARQRMWSLGYRFKSGHFRVRHSAHGPQLYAECINMDEIDIRSDNPKILSAAGNCLMGHMVDEGSIACAWMHSAGVRQMVGYTMPTWFGYGGWGVHKYFTRLPGRLSFCEAFFANMQALLAELQAQPGAPAAAIAFEGSSSEIDRFCGDIYRRCFDTEESVEGVARAQLGLLFDRDHVVFYGDPAWDARLPADPSLPLPYTIGFEVIDEDAARVRWRVVLSVHSDGSWTAPTPDDKTCVPGRPAFALLPARLRSAAVESGSAQATRLFVLFTLAGPCHSGESFEAIVSGVKQEAVRE